MLALMNRRDLFSLYTAVLSLVLLPVVHTFWLSAIFFCVSYFMVSRKLLIHCLDDLIYFISIPFVEIHTLEQWVFVGLRLFLSMCAQIRHFKINFDDNFNIAICLTIHRQSIVSVTRGGRHDC